MLAALRTWIGWDSKSNEPPPPNVRGNNTLNAVNAVSNEQNTASVQQNEHPIQGNVVVDIHPIVAANAPADGLSTLASTTSITPTAAKPAVLRRSSRTKKRIRFMGDSESDNENVQVTLSICHSKDKGKHKRHCAKTSEADEGDVASLDPLIDHFRNASQSMVARVRSGFTRHLPAGTAGAAAAMSGDGNNCEETNQDNDENNDNNDNEDNDDDVDSKVLAEPTRWVPEDVSIALLAQDILTGRVRNIVVLTGAGISTAAGIPDYRGSTSISGTDLDTTDVKTNSSSVVTANTGVDVVDTMINDIPPTPSTLNIRNGVGARLPCPTIRVYSNKHPCCVALREMLLETEGFQHVATDDKWRSRVVMHDVKYRQDPFMHTESLVCLIRLVGTPGYHCERMSAVLNARNGSLITNSSSSSEDQSFAHFSLTREGNVFHRCRRCTQNSKVLFRVPAYITTAFFDAPVDGDRSSGAVDPHVQVLQEDPFQLQKRSDVSSTTTERCLRQLTTQPNQWMSHEQPHAQLPQSTSMSDLYQLAQTTFGLHDKGEWMSKEFYDKNPAAFYAILQRLDPWSKDPTVTHQFIAFLLYKGLLAGNYTQNVDGLQFKTHIPIAERSKIQEVHGSMLGNVCSDCKSSLLPDDYRQQVRTGGRPTCRMCLETAVENGISIDAKPVPVVRPDIVFQGERLSNDVLYHVANDFRSADLLLVIGTSLRVHPFASWLDLVPVDCMRVLMNEEKVGEPTPLNETREYQLMMQGLREATTLERRDEVRQLIAAFIRERRTGFDFANTKRDLFLQGRCDTQVLRLLDALDWREEFMTWLGGRQVAQSRYPLLSQPRLEPAVAVPLAELDPAFRGGGLQLLSQSNHHPPVFGRGGRAQMARRPFSVDAALAPSTDDY